MLSRENLDLYAMLINLIKTFGMVSNLEMYKKNLAVWILSVSFDKDLWRKVNKGPKESIKLV